MQGFFRRARKMILAVLPDARAARTPFALDNNQSYHCFDRYRGFSKGVTCPELLYLEADGSEEHTLFLVRNRDWTNILCF